MFKIGYRTLKTAVGCGLAVAIAQGLSLQFYAAAGVIAILSIKTTKKRSYQSAIDRFVACILAIGIAAIIFPITGYVPWAISIILLLLFPLGVTLKVTEGLVTSVVVLLHFYTLGEMSSKWVINELILITIGIGIALLVNLYMPSVEKDLKSYRVKIESNFQLIFQEFAYYLRHGESDWDGKEIVETDALLQKAKEIALLDIENHAYDREYNYYRYFNMRSKQFEIIERILPSVSSFNACVEQGEEVAAFLDHIADAVCPHNSAHLFLDELEEMRKKFKHSPLPTTRKEFEMRASLMHIVEEMKRYLILKQSLKIKAREAGKLGSHKHLWEGEGLRLQTVTIKVRNWLKR
ncbi:aromatic acid exporter family protein [Hazenella sp. IB182353]|uniref:aromatic acid exporter family protein n=1 Tax=Polycladospora coralii TaxID=2771432 RepID=UPI0017462FC6|nr:aromatic acid exporter family protein [Polycladospora coralii]MBS7529443.1 aromatic acid exporter family protein [Polycladospora coralii]